MTVIEQISRKLFDLGCSHVVYGGIITPTQAARDMGIEPFLEFEFFWPDDSEGMVISEIVPERRQPFAEIGDLFLTLEPTAGDRVSA